MSAVEIPDAAVRAAAPLLASYGVPEEDRFDAASEVLNLGAPLVLAADYRRMADAADAELVVARADLKQATAGGPRYSELYARAAALAFHRDELERRADDLDPARGAQ